MSNPFPGLRPFEDGEGYLFFGRETQVDELLGRLRVQRLIAVVGTSGSGKSSLIRAGLFSALRVGGMSGAGSRWRIATMRPGNDPMGELAAELERAGLLGTDGDPELRIDLAYAILERGALGLVEIVRQMPIRPDENVLIVVDQFEELFRYAQTNEDTAAAFVDLLLEATSLADLRLYVVVTMRSDFLGDCAAFAHLPERINRGLYLVPRMSREQLEAAIVGPVKVAGAQIASPLVNRLLNDVGDDPDQLPVLAHALMLTYDLWAADRGPGDPIDERQYRATGGLAQAIDAHAERIYAALSPERRAVADKLFAAITELGSDNRGIRRPLAFADLCASCDAEGADVRAIVDAYRARTVSFLRPAADVPLTDHTVVDISHEALMRGWSRLRRLLTEEVEAARTYERLVDAAQLHGEGKGALLVDPALALNLEWRKRFQPTAGWADRYGGAFASAMAFLERSSAEHVRERRAKRSASRRRWALAVSVIVLLAVLTFASATSFVDAQRERTKSLVSQSKFFARDANADIEKGDAVTAALLALEALPLSISRPDRPFEPAAAYALENALNSVRQLHMLETGAQPRHVAYSPDGTRIAVQMFDHTVRLYDVRSDKVRFDFPDRDEHFLGSVAFSPDGRRVVAPSSHHTARIWDAFTGKLLGTLRGHRDDVNSAKFSKDGKFIVTSSLDGTARIWRSDTGTIVRIFHLPEQLTYADFSPDGSHIVAAVLGSIVRVFDVATGRETKVLRAHIDSVFLATYSPDGTRIATGGYDGTAIVWNARRGSVEHILRGHSGIVFAVGFSPDGTTIVTASTDGTARLWSASTGALLGVIGGHADDVFGAVFSPDGKNILTVSADGTVRTWRAAPTGEERVLSGSRGALYTISYSPDGRRIASVTAGGSVRIWNARTGKTLLVLGNAWSIDFSPDGERIVSGTDRGFRISNAKSGKAIVAVRSIGQQNLARYSPDGKRIVSAGIEDVAHVWDAMSGARLLDIRGHTQQLNDVVFSRDGSRIATASIDGTARIWRARDGKQLSILRGHTGVLFAVKFSPDGTRVMTAGSDGTARVWDATTGDVILTIRPKLGPLVESLFSPDGTEIALAAGTDKTVRLYEAKTGALLATMRGHEDTVYDVGFSPDGKHLASSSADKTVRIWAVPPRKRCQQLIDEARRTVPGSLTAVQRAEEFVSDRAPVPLFNTFGSASACP